MIALAACVALAVVALIIGLFAGDDDEDHTATVDPTTTEPAPENDDAPRAEPVDVDAEGECLSDPASTLYVDAEPGTAPGYEYLRIERVEITDDGDNWRVEWTLAGDVPDELESPEGMPTSASWDIFLTSADEGEGASLHYSLTVQLIGDETFVSVTEWDGMQTERSGTSATIDGATITATYPKSLTPDTDGLYWFAHAEGDGDPDPGFEDFELFFTVQHRCPDRDRDGSFLQGERLRL
jgi:hypothetical protein